MDSELLKKQLANDLGEIFKSFFLESSKKNNDPVLKAMFGELSLTQKKSALGGYIIARLSTGGDLAKKMNNIFATLAQTYMSVS